MEFHDCGYIVPAIKPKELNDSLSATLLARSLSLSANRSLNTISGGT